MVKLSHSHHLLGTGLKRLTAHESSDGHAAWVDDGNDILWKRAKVGYRHEACIYDRICPSYGEVVIVEPWR